MSDTHRLKDYILTCLLQDFASSQKTEKKLQSRSRCYHKNKPMWLSRIGVACKQINHAYCSKYLKCTLSKNKLLVHQAIVDYLLSAASRLKWTNSCSACDYHLSQLIILIIHFFLAAHFVTFSNNLSFRVMSELLNGLCLIDKICHSYKMVPWKEHWT